MIAMRLGAHGPGWSLASACATGAHAIGEAARMIARGEADAVRRRRHRGGADRALPGRLPAHGRALPRGRLAPVRRPARRLRHGRGRRGASSSSARSTRGPAARTCWARVAGYGASNDAFHITAARRGRAGRRPRRCARRSPTRGRRPATSATSTPTARRRRSTTASRRLAVHQRLRQRLGAAGLLDEVGDRAPARRRRRGRGDRVRSARSERGAAPADAQLRGARSRVRRRLRARRAARGAGPRARPVQLVRVRRAERLPGLARA